MKETIRTLSTGEKVYICDEVFDAHECEHFNLFAQQSSYRCFNSSPLNETLTYASLSCSLDDNDVQNFNFFSNENYKKIEHHFYNKRRTRSWITLIKLAPEIYYHCDNTIVGAKTLLYYINMKWNKNYGGETIICNSQGEVELAISTKPNRVVIFDSYLHHKPTGLSPISPPNRFSFVSIWR